MVLLIEETTTWQSSGFKAIPPLWDTVVHCPLITGQEQSSSPNS